MTGVSVRVRDLGARRVRRSALQQKRLPLE
jgi:hypothetical protein